MLEDTGILNHRLLLFGRSRTSKRFDGRGGLPLLEHVDTATVERVCAQVEVDAAGNCTSETNDVGTSSQVRLTLLRLDEEGTGNDDHRSIVAEPVARRPYVRASSTSPARHAFRAARFFRSALTHDTVNDMTYDHISTTSARQRKQIGRVTAVLGEPVTASASFRVEGTLPWYLLGVVVGVGVLQGALGAVIGLGLGFVIARLVTRGRAAGFGFTTILAVTETHLHALKAGFWSGRPTANATVASWSLAALPIEIRHKRLTTAVSLSLPDGRQVRLESASRKGAQRLISHLRPTGS